MFIRQAKNSDKDSVLKFCKNTFSWGDYIDKVWEFWISEKNLFLIEDQKPIGICHAFFSDDQVWIEGIRVDSEYRRKKIASKLVNHVESIGYQKNISFSYMLIDVQNIPSLSLANSLGYEKHQTWNFYTLESRKNSNFKITFENNLDSKSITQYVRSWRWFPITAKVLSSLHRQNKIIKSEIDKKNSIAIITDSEHFENTLIVTLFSNSQKTTLHVIQFLQNYGFEKKYERIQILSQESLNLNNSLNYRLSFNLMKKQLS